MRKYVLMVYVALVAAGVYAAGEITANFTLKVTKGNLDITRVNAGSYTLTNANPNVAGFTQLIPTTAGGTALTLGDVVTNGVCWFRNLDTNNWVEVGVQVAATFYPLVRLNANEAWSFRMAQGIAPFARANTASVTLEKLIFDN